MELRKIKVQRFGSPTYDFNIYKYHGIHPVWVKQYNGIVSYHVIEYDDGEIHKIGLDEPYHITLLPIEKK